MRLFALAAVVLAVTIVLGACGGDDDDDEAGNPVATTVATTVVTESAPDHGDSAEDSPGSDLTTADLCGLLTTDEVGSVMGEKVSANYAFEDECIYESVTCTVTTASDCDRDVRVFFGASSMSQEEYVNESRRGRVEKADDFEGVVLWIEPEFAEEEEVRGAWFEVDGSAVELGLTCYSSRPVCQTYGGLERDDFLRLVEAAQN